MANPLLFGEGKQRKTAQFVSGPSLGWELSENPWLNLAAGVALVVVSMMLISYNERQAVHGTQARAEGINTATPASSNIIFPVNEGKLVYVTGEMKGAGPVADRSFRIGSESAICLLRKVETNQWVEKKEDYTDSQGYLKTAYVYNTVWSEKILDSSGFAKPGHSNPDTRLFPSQPFMAATARLEAFKLDPELCRLYDAYRPILLTQDDYDAMPQKYRMYLKLKDGVLYKSYKPDNPAIGDTRITFFAASPENATILARQEKETLAPVILPTGQMVGAFRQGTEALDKIFTPPGGHGLALSIFLRLMGLAGMACGLMLVLGPLELFISFRPKLHGLLEKSPMREAALVSLGASLWLMAPGWYSFQPLATLGLALAGVAPVALFARDYRSAEPKPAPEPPAGPKPTAVETAPEELPPDGAPLDMYKPKKVAYFAPPSDPWGAAAQPAASQPVEAYTPKKPPSAMASAQEPSAAQPPSRKSAPPPFSRVIEHVLVFHEAGKIDKGQVAEMVRKKEASPDGMVPKVLEVAGIHINSWPQDKKTLQEYIKKGIAAHAGKHPDAARYQDNKAYRKKMWTGKTGQLGRFLVVLSIPIKQA